MWYLFCINIFWLVRNPIYSNFIHFDPFWSILDRFDPFWFKNILFSYFFSDDEDDSDIDEISEVPKEANGDADSDSDSEEFMLDGAPETEVLSSD